MKMTYGRTFQPAAPQTFVILGLLTVSLGMSQSSPQSPSDAIRFLTYQSDRPEKLVVMMGMEGCGYFERNRTAAKALVKFGARAIPDLERAIDSLDERGEESVFSLNGGWLLEAYARINGLYAYSRLRRMMGNPKIAFLQGAIDEAAAVSLGLTSYVHGSRPPERVFRCDRSAQPRDALDQLILGWLRNDRPSLEQSLGPIGRAALTQLLKGKDWRAIRAELWQAQSDNDAALGYRFQGYERWSLSGRMMEAGTGYDNTLPNTANPELHTLFTSRSGQPCSARTVKFRAEGPGVRTFMVDDPNLADLLREIASCGTKDE